MSRVRPRRWRCRLGVHAWEVLGWAQRAGKAHIDQRCRRCNKRRVRIVRTWPKHLR